MIGIMRNKDAAVEVAEPGKSFRVVLGLLAIKVITQNEQLFFVLSLIAFLWLMIRGARFRIPHLFGLAPFLTLCAIYTLFGLINHEPRNVIRDVYYILPSFLWMIIAYMLATNREFREGRSMLRTLYLYGALVSVSCYIRFALGGDVSFNGLRNAFVYGVYDTGFTIPLLAYHLLVRCKVCFSRRMDLLLLLVMVSQVALSFGRISIAEPITCLLVMLFVVLITGEKNGGSARILALMAALLIAVLLALWIMPESTTSVLIDKIGNSFSEVNASSSIKTVDDAMKNWRGYEIQAAIQQWEAAPWYIQLFGSFFGEGIHVNLIPYNWTSMVENNSIPLLHNGFLTLLPKMGIVGVVIFLLLYLSVFSNGVRLIRMGEEGKEAGTVLVSVIIASLFTTYVVRGPISEQAFFAWAVLIGWYFGSAEIVNGSL